MPFLWRLVSGLEVGAPHAVVACGDFLSEGLDTTREKDSTRKDARVKHDLKTIPTRAPATGLSHGRWN